MDARKRTDIRIAGRNHIITGNDSERHVKSACELPRGDATGRLPPFTFSGHIHAPCWEWQWLFQTLQYFKPNKISFHAAHKSASSFHIYYREALSQNDYFWLFFAQLDYDCWIYSISARGLIFCRSSPPTIYFASPTRMCYAKGSQQKYPRFCRGFEGDVWTHHHGPRNASEQVRHFVKEKEIFDIGAHMRNSLMNWFHKPLRSLKVTQIDESCKAYCSHHGVIWKAGYMNVAQKRSIGSSIQSWGPVTVRLVTIGDEVREHNLPIGFIKIDIEEYDLVAFKGAIKTL
jgi:hypothetical protein